MKYEREVGLLHEGYAIDFGTQDRVIGSAVTIDGNGVLTTDHTSINFSLSDKEFTVYPMGTTCCLCNKFVHVLMGGTICIKCAGEEEIKEAIIDKSLSVTGIKPQKMKFHPWTGSGNYTTGYTFDEMAYDTVWDPDCVLSLSGAIGTSIDYIVTSTLGSPHTHSAVDTSDSVDYNQL